MTFVYTAPPQGPEGFEQRCHTAGIRVIGVKHARDFQKFPDADLYIDGAFDGTFVQLKAPLLFHCPAVPFFKMEEPPLNCARFCAWPGFWERPAWEMAKYAADEALITQMLANAGIKAIWVADVAGLIAPRILCTIINEAAYTLAEGVADARDIDTAMKLGTNYPYGPAEWAQKIGIEEVTKVLEAMSFENKRYLPHPAIKFLAG